MTAPASCVILLLLATLTAAGASSPPSVEAVGAGGDGSSSTNDHIKVGVDDSTEGAELGATAEDRVAGRTAADPTPPSPSFAASSSLSSAAAAASLTPPRDAAASSDTRASSSSSSSSSSTSRSSTDKEKDEPRSQRFGWWWFPTAVVHVLVVAPLSVLDHWEREVEAFTDMRVARLDGAAAEREWVKANELWEEGTSRGGLVGCSVDEKWRRDGRPSARKQP